MSGNSISTSVFGSLLESKLKKLDGIPPEAIASVKASVHAIFALPQEQQTSVITAYASAITSVFLIGVPATVITSLSGLLITKRRIITKAATPAL